jgi:SAM-dependent methyltransferase
VLDIGCGIGFWVAPYTERGARFTGVDISPTAVDKLRERFSQAEFIHADVSAPDCRPLGQYDVINIWDVLYHVVSDEGFANAAANIRQAARPGAKVLVSDWFTCGADRRVAEHVVYRPLATYERVWGPLGFELMDHLPLYRWLSRSDNRFPRVARRLGALHYALDSLQRRPGGILSLAVWRCV